jgi:hypothetical protein
VLDLPLHGVHGREVQVKKKNHCIREYEVYEVEKIFMGLLNQPLFRTGEICQHTKCQSLQIKGKFWMTSIRLNRE